MPSVRKSRDTDVKLINAESIVKDYILEVVHGFAFKSNHGVCCNGSKSDFDSDRVGSNPTTPVFFIRKE